MKDQYSLLTPWYSSLVRLMFGDQLKKSKLCLLGNTRAKKILIIGGGDGMDYQEIAADISGEYWELSASMLKKARVNLRQSNLDFHLGYFNTEEGKQFDEIWLHFLLDTMTDESIHILLQELSIALRKDGTLQFVDFFPSTNLFQAFVTRVMITFFQLFTGHQRKNLPNYEMIFADEKWVKKEQMKLMGGWVKAQIWTL